MSKYIKLSLSVVLIFSSLFLSSCADMVKSKDMLPASANNSKSEQLTVETIGNYDDVMLPGEKYPFKLPAPTLSEHAEDEFEKDRVSVHHTDFKIDEATEKQFMDLVNNNTFNIGCYVIDLETGASFGYNGTTEFTPACTIKAGYALYVMRMAAKGEISLDDKLVFKSKHQFSGTGYIWKKGVGAELTVREIVEHMIHESDNVAYMMLVDYYGADGYNELMEQLGVKNRITEYKKWTKLTPRDLGLIWSEIYRFKDQCEEGAFLWDVATHNLYNFVSYALNDCAHLGYETIAHKSGYGEHEYNDGSVVMGEHPYVLVCMTQIDARTYAFVKTCQWCDKVIKQYWEYESQKAVQPAENQ